MRDKLDLSNLCLDEKSQIIFIYKSTENNKKIQCTIEPGQDLGAILTLFEQFLLAIGFDIPQGMGIGVVVYSDNDDNDEDQEENTKTN